MTSPGVASHPRGDARAAAIERFEAFAQTLERLGLQDFRLVVPAAQGRAERQAWRAEAERIAAAAGIGDVLRAARSAVGEHVARVYAGGGFRPTWAGLNWGLSTGPAEDQAAAIEAVEDAVTAVVVEPLAPPELVDGLREPYERMAIAHPMPSTDGELPDVFRRRGPAGLPIVLLVVLGLAVAGWALGGWTLVAIPVLLLTWVARRGRRMP